MRGGSRFFKSQKNIQQSVHERISRLNTPGSLENRAIRDLRSRTQKKNTFDIQAKRRRMELPRQDVALLILVG